MSSYYANAVHPLTGKWKPALWQDDYFGPRRYGVVFEDGSVWRPEDVEADERKARETGVGCPVHRVEDGGE